MTGTSPAPAPAPALAWIHGEDGTGSGVDIPLAIPPCPGGLFHFPPGSVLVEDADEEVMELYMDLASVSSSSPDDSPDSGGLGFLDPTKSAIEIDWELTPEAREVGSGVVKTQGEHTTSGTGGADGADGARGGTRRKVTGGRGLRKSSQAHAPTPPRSVLVRATIQQDLGALKGRKGDTGSVLWRSSLHLAHHLLTQHHFPPSTHLPLLDPAALGRTAILELGSGTGVLAVLLSGICGGYTASDRIENLRLVKRNLELNGVGVGAGNGGGTGYRSGNGSGSGSGSRHGGGGGGGKGMIAGGSTSGGSGGATETSSGGRNVGKARSRGIKESGKYNNTDKGKHHDGETDAMHNGRRGRHGHGQLGRIGQEQRNPRASTEVSVEEVDWVAVSEGVVRRRLADQRLTGESPVSSPTSPTAPMSPTSPRSPRSPIYPAGWPEMSRTEPTSYFQSIGTQSPLSANGSASASAGASAGASASRRFDDTSPPLDSLSLSPHLSPRLILAVDCIYNEHLVRPLVDTLEHYCPPGGGTVVWVVVELRSADVLTLFLDTWLNGNGGTATATGWTVVRLGPGGMGSWEGRKGRWVGWVGWR